MQYKDDLIMKTMIRTQLESHKKAIQKVIDSLPAEIQEACEMAVSTIKSGNKIMFCGNGGSAADAQHLAAELCGRYKKERKGLAALALTTDTSALTAIANDYAYDLVFSRQIEALAKSGDLIIGISSTGTSRNIINAFKTGKELSCKTIGFSGKGGGKFVGQCDLNVVVPSNDIPRVQEMHILIGHTICQAIDDSCA